MSKLDDAMRKHINYLVFEECRPFSFCDFSTFKVDGKEYTMSHGTFRNKVSKMIKAG
jgi:abortive infection bacteriophage resistance protein